ncbi:MAG: FAD-dependent oxidoreductase [Deltaproteobacteria bacterium]|nr:FAD-dependent oxidoreductase [Deltaproteobacteria bacterium]MBW2137727.1 FAD-dependent oxidoreductase [Deltaproteobacteria bacterium]
MARYKYLIVGASHAGLSALDSIRLTDREGPITMVNREARLPYSPTILPYVLSGRVDPSRIFLKDKEGLKRMGVRYLQGTTVSEVDQDAGEVVLSSGERVGYEKLLLATGASPASPEIDGLEEVPYHVLRTLDDALKLQREFGEGRSALVIGAGLIGMHAAESMAEWGMDVTVLEAEASVLPGYFDETPARMIQDVFQRNGVKIRVGSRIGKVSRSKGTHIVEISSGESLSADLILVATGVKPNRDCLKESGIRTDKGILVDERMRTSAAAVWAAGDVAQAKDLLDGQKRLHATLPDAVEQGRIAGMDMAGDASLKDYRGGIPMNVFKFFGSRALSLGTSVNGEPEAGIEVDQVFLPGTGKFLKLVFEGPYLVGAVAINTDLDPGVMHEIIRGRIDLRDSRALFVERPKEIGRILMTNLWR